MKKLMLIFIVSLLTLIGCSSTGSIKDVESINPVGVVSVISNGEITWYGEETENPGLLGKFLAKKINEAKDDDVSTLLSRADTLVNDADRYLMAALSKVDTISTVDKEVILGSKSYTNAEEDNMLVKTELILADGYKFVNYRDKDLASDLNEEIGIRGDIYIQFDFKKIVMSGVAKNGKVGVFVGLSAIIVNQDGKTVLIKSFTGKSESTIPVVAGIYDPRELMDLFPSVIEEVCESFVATFYQ